MSDSETHGQIPLTTVSIPSQLSTRAWVLILLCALGFLIWTNVARIRHIESVSATAGWSVPEAAGNDDWRPRLIVPEHDNISYEWLDQTRQMFALREWRVRHVDYENAPGGREVSSASPYRWWLGLVAWIDHIFSGRPLGWSIERAALVADPLVHLLLLVGATIFVARRFGIFPAVFVAIGLATLFPLAAEFLPGMPNERALAHACAIWSMLTLLAGTKVAYSATADAGKQARRWFFLSGIIGGLGLWISASCQAPILAGIAVGALIAAWVARGDANGNPEGISDTGRWRAWATGGTVTILATYLVEFFPSHLGSWELRAIHPLYGLAWLGGGELLATAVAWIQRRSPGKNCRDIAVLMLAVAAVAALPVAMWRTHNLGFLAVDLPALRLVRLPGGVAAADTMEWISRDGFTAAACATMLPLLLVVPAVWLLSRRKTGLGSRIAIALSLGPVLVALGFACRQLSWWNGLDGALLVLMVATVVAMQGAFHPLVFRWLASGFAALVLMPGVLQVIPRGGTGANSALNDTELYQLIERDFARWLALHAGTPGAVVLAPHNETTTLYYYGGVKGLATLGWENPDGLGVAVRIVSASTPEEARALIERRGVTHILIPSWDSYLDLYARMGMGQLDGTFLSWLHNWKLPPWIRPVVYRLPTINSFEKQSVTVFEVVEDQEDATAGGRLAEYFIEMDRLDLAASAAQALRRFPSDLGALVGRAQVESARGEKENFARSVEVLLTRLSRGADRNLPWDRRVAFAVVLAQGHHVDLARVQLGQCLAEIDEGKLRSLPTGSLYHLQVLSKATGSEIADPHLRKLARDLLPEDLRQRL